MAQLNSLAAFRNLTDLPIVPKGIKTWQDALTCLHLGFPAIYVSNHGGRVLDGVPTSVEILLDIRKNAPEVFAGMEVYADGGVRRGTDALILLALGARAVGLGRPWVSRSLRSPWSLKRLFPQTHVRQHLGRGRRFAPDQSVLAGDEDEHAAHGCRKC
jgi:isopentenyl diphosphate isomerase/L-lactate dehydrogenase-like FMN-dependent dehydrogenase